MSYTARTNHYLEADILSRSPHWLVPLLYEHLCASMRRAIVQIEAGDLEGKAASLEKASAILLELLASLDHENGGEIAQNLSSLYVFFASELATVGRTLDVVRLARMAGMVAELHEAWTEAAEAVEADSPAGAVLQASGI